MSSLMEVVAQGTIAALLATVLLIPGSAAATPKHKLGTLINGDKLASTESTLRVTNRGRRLSSLQIPPEEIRDNLPYLITQLSLNLEASGVDPTTISSSPGYMPNGVEAEFVSPRQPLRLAFYNRLDSSRSQAQQAYIMDRLLPATAAVLRHSVRVRTPSGPLMLPGIQDEEGEIIPGPVTGLEADMLLKVTSQPQASAECEGVVASAAPIIFEYITARPLYGVVRLCTVSEDAFFYDITTLVHEIIHALGFIGTLYPVYPGYGGDGTDVAAVVDGRTLMVTPNVVATVREFFQCPQMAGAAMEDDGGQGTANAHWEERMFEGEMLDAGDAGSELHYNRHVLTDLTLSLLQDTNWYDVKYGSAGFNSYGYKAGCEFAMGSFEQAYAVPAAARYLCSGDFEYEQDCLPDASGDGVCLSLDNWDGFYRVYQFDDVNFDCQGETPGSRCLLRPGSTFSRGSIGCVAMRCSADGEVLVEGEPCDSGEAECPNKELMCGDPGMLTCATAELNDCSGYGDCKLGHCFCHAGWGGPDCSTQVCVSQCEDGSPCPASGFCGVEECGEWSVGSSSRGVPCDGGTVASDGGTVASDGGTVASDGGPVASAAGNQTGTSAAPESGRTPSSSSTGNSSAAPAALRTNVCAAAVAAVVMLFAAGWAS